VPKTRKFEAPRRKPSASELAFFKSRPDVAGMASGGAVVLNPYSPLSAREKEAVVVNETARVLMQQRPEYQPKFDITPQQEERFAGYGSPQNVRDTIAARIVSGDPSAGRPTFAQNEISRRIARLMGVSFTPRGGGGQ
tara:strand:+ start:179 stop:592 length:414 start_codon:yes stop_codon:yes gene_type:complete